MNNAKCGCPDGEMSFLCCVTLADLAQAHGDANSALHYIAGAYAAMDRQATSAAPLFGGIADAAEANTDTDTDTEMDLELV